MSRQIDISKLNPHKMVEVRALPAKYHRGNINTQLQQELIRPGEERTYFMLPVERLQPFRFVFNATVSASRTLQVITGRGDVKLTIPLTNSISLGNISETGDPLIGYVYKLADLTALPSDGTYYLLLTVNFDATNTRTFVSEPFELRATHPGTVLFEYWSTINRDEVFFELLPVRFSMRLKGIVELTTPGSKNTTFENSAAQLRLLKAQPFRTWELRIGGNGTGVAMWVPDKLNHVFGCNNVFIDGTQFLADADASWDETSVANVPVAGYKLALREADESAATTHIDPVVDLFTIPAFPFAATSVLLQMKSGSIASLLALGAGVVINNTAQLNALITAMNTHASFQELTGTVSISGSKVIYTNGAGERYLTGAARLLTTFFGFNFVSPGVTGSGPGALVPRLDFTYRRGTGVIDWGDGSVESYYFASAATGAGHVYGGPAGTYPVRIFGTLESFAVSNAYRSGLVGTLPAGLKELSISRGTFPANTFLFSVLQPVAQSLILLNITYAGLTAANGFNQIYIPKLLYIDFSGNSFNSTVMGAFAFDVHYNASHQPVGGPILSGGVFSIGGQTTGAKLNAQGITYKNALESAPFNWTVNP